MNNSNFIECLTMQEQLIEQMQENLFSQSRFLNTPHMKGLHRLTQAFAILIKRFAVVRSQLLQEPSWQQVKECNEKYMLISTQYDAMLSHYRCLFDHAVSKRRDIGAAIGKFKQQRHMKNHYVRQWQIASAGHCFSAKG